MIRSGCPVGGARGATKQPCPAPGALGVAVPRHSDISDIFTPLVRMFTGREGRRIAAKTFKTGYALGGRNPRPLRKARSAPLAIFTLSLFSQGRRPCTPAVPCGGRGGEGEDGSMKAVRDSDL